MFWQTRKKMDVVNVVGHKASEERKISLKPIICGTVNDPTGLT